MVATAGTPEKGYPRKKSRFSSKAVRQKQDTRERNWVEQKNSDFFSKTVGKKRGIGERNWVDEKKSKIFQKW